MIWPTRLFPCALLLTAIAGCGGSDSEDPGERPTAPDENDPAFEIQRAREWLLIGNALTQGQDDLELQVFAPEGVDKVVAWLDDRPGVVLTRGDGDFREIIDVSNLPAGEHELILAADEGAMGFARLPIHRSHPLYVVVTTDWDDADNSPDSLALQEQLHANHDELKLTHFVGPYTFTDETVSDEREGELVNWVSEMRDTYGDEVGLHIHPYCNFVDTTEVTCRTEPSTVYDDGDTTGYTIMVSAYTDEEFTDLLLAADALFEDAGLGKPTSFRAGGWTAEIGTLRALAAAGYVADTSANNWQRLEEWEGVQNGVLYEWNQEHWATIDDTSQPYYPSEGDILSADAPQVSVLEVPDNGILVDYVTAEEMIDIFQANWDGTALLAPTAYSIGYHPPNFNFTYYERMHGALGHADQFLASQDAGPVVYATLSQLVQVWPSP